MTTIAPYASLAPAPSYAATGSPVSAPVAAPTDDVSSTRITSTAQGTYIETLGKLKISEVDGKDTASIFSSSPDEGEVLSKRAIDASAADATPTPQQGQPQPAQKINDDGGGAEQRINDTRQAVVQSNPQPASVPGATATLAYQAVGGFGGGGSAAQPVFA